MEISKSWCHGNTCQLAWGFSKGFPKVASQDLSPSLCDMRLHALSTVPHCKICFSTVRKSRGADYTQQDRSVSSKKIVMKTFLTELHSKLCPLMGCAFGKLHQGNQLSPVALTFGSTALPHWTSSAVWELRLLSAWPPQPQIPWCHLPFLPSPHTDIPPTHLCLLCFQLSSQS